MCNLSRETWNAIKITIRLLFYAVLFVSGGVIAGLGIVTLIVLCVCALAPFLGFWFATPFVLIAALLCYLAVETWWELKLIRIVRSRVEREQAACARAGCHICIKRSQEESKQAACARTGCHICMKRSQEAAKGKGTSSVRRRVDPYVRTTSCVASGSTRVRTRESSNSRDTTPSTSRVVLDIKIPTSSAPRQVTTSSSSDHRPAIPDNSTSPASTPREYAEGSHNRHSKHPTEKLEAEKSGNPEAQSPSEALDSRCPCNENSKQDASTSSGTSTTSSDVPNVESTGSKDADSETASH